MAEEEQQQEAEAAAAPAAKADSSGPSKVGKMIGLVAVLLSLVCLGGSVALIYFATYGFIPPTVTEEDVYEKYEAMRITREDEPAIYTLDEFSVNLNGVPKRSIRIQISLHMLSEEGFQEIGELNAEAKDSIIRLVGSKSFEDLETIQGKLFLKQQIAKNINHRLKEGVIKEVYFNEFLIR